MVAIVMVSGHSRPRAIAGRRQRPESGLPWRAESPPQQPSSPPRPLAGALLPSRSMRRVVVALVLAGCDPSSGPGAFYAEPPPPESSPPDAVDAPIDLSTVGTTIAKSFEFAYDGGKIEFEMRRDGDRVIEVARNHYAVPIVMQWQLDNVVNMVPLAPPGGVAVLPAAPVSNGIGTPVVLTTERIVDPSAPFHHDVPYHARFGNPAARPVDYAYRL